MNSRNSTRSRLLAVSLTLIMLISVGGIAFTGGAAAQSTGGTFDGLFSDQEKSDLTAGSNVVNDALNIPKDNGTLRLVGSVDSNNNPKVADNGDILIPGDNNAGTFEGLTFGQERVEAINEERYNSKIDLLSNISEFNVSANKTALDEEVTGITLIELAPQSDFSQITANGENINGTHDFIVVGPANASDTPIDDPTGGVGERASGTQLNRSVSVNITNKIKNGNVGQNDYVALSVDNDDLGVVGGGDAGDANASLLANGSTISSTFGQLLGTDTNDLQEENIDNVRFAAGTFKSQTSGQNAGVAIEEVRINYIGDQEFDSSSAETIHHEKITVETKGGSANPTYESYYSNLSRALQAAQTDSDKDTITLDAGHYANETDQPLNINSNVTIQTTDSVSTAPTIERIDTDNAVGEQAGLNSTSKADGSEARINASLNITGANTVFDNVVVENKTQSKVSSSDELEPNLVNLSANNVTFQNTILNLTRENTTAVNVTDSPFDATSGNDDTNVTGTSVTDSVILSQDPMLFEGDTGINLAGNASNGTIANNFFVGLETPVGQINDTATTTQIYNANLDEFTEDLANRNVVDIASQYNDTNVAQSAVPINTDTGAVNATEITASVNRSNQLAGIDDRIDVSAGTYDGTNTTVSNEDYANEDVIIDTQNVSVSGAGSGATILYAPTDTDDIILNSTESASFTGITIPNGNISVEAQQAGDGDLLDRPSATIDDVDMNGKDTNITANASDLTVSNVAFQDAGVAAIELTDSLNTTQDYAGNLTVEDVDVDGFRSPTTGGTADTSALNLTEGVGNNVTISRFNVSTGSNSLAAGDFMINITGAGPRGKIIIENSRLADVGGGTGINIKQVRDQGWDSYSYKYTAVVRDNELNSSQAGFTGVRLDTLNISEDLTREDYKDAVIANGTDDEDISGATFSGLTGLGSEANANLQDNTIVSSQEEGSVGVVVDNGTFIEEDAVLDIFDSDVNEDDDDQPGPAQDDVRRSEIKIDSDETVDQTSFIIEQNSIGGVDRVVESHDGVSAGAYDDIVANNNNNLGTVVTGPNAGTEAFENGYTAAYGFNGTTDVVDDAQEGLSKTDSYLPGTLNESLKLVSEAEEAGFPAAAAQFGVANPFNRTNTFTPDLELQEPNVTVYNAPQFYNATDSADKIAIPDLNRTSISGATQSVEIRNSVVIANESNLNNVELHDVTINSTDNEPGVAILANSSQTDINNVVINADTTGVFSDGSAPDKEGDVNVINVTNSDITAGASGIDVSGTTLDDRDGLVIHDNDINGPDVGTAGSVGLEFHNVAVPGKPTTDIVGLNVTDNSVESFEVQANFSDNNPLPFNGSDLLGVSSSSISNQKITVSNNQFKHAVLIYNQSDTSEAKNNVVNNTLYGSIDKADARASAAFDQTGPEKVGGEGDIAILSVEHPDAQTQDRIVYRESISLGDSLDSGTNDEGAAGISAVEVRGPQYGTAATDQYRGDEAVISDNGLNQAGSSDDLLTVTPANNASNVTVDGFTLVGTNEVFIDNTTGQTLTSAGPGLAEDPNALDAVVNVSQVTPGANAQGVNTTFIKNTSVSLNAIETEVNATRNVLEEPGESVATPVNNTVGIRATNTSSNSTVLDGVFVGDHNAVSTTGTAVQAEEDMTIIDSSFVSNTTLQDVSPRADFSGDSVRDNSGLSPDAFGAGINATNATLEVFENDLATTGIGKQLSVSNSEIRDFSTAGFEATRDAEINATFSGTTIDNARTGVNITNTDDKATISLTSDSKVLNSRADGLNETSSETAILTITDSSVTNSGGDGVNLGGDSDPAITNVTIESNTGTGLNITDADVARDANENVTANNFISNGEAISLGSVPSGATNKLNVTLNYFGSPRGPNAGSDNGLVGEQDHEIVYDPYLTEDTSSDDVDAADVGTSTAFASDVVIESNYTSVGLPAQPADEANTLDEMFDFDPRAGVDDQAVYVFDADGKDEFQTLGEATNFNKDTTLSAGDAFVVANPADNNVTAAISYTNEKTPGSLSTISYETGVNFVAPAAAGDVDDVLFPGSNEDYVATGALSAGENLYGLDNSSSNTTLSEPTASAEFLTNSTFGSNFQGGVGADSVHPHRGYFVVVNDEANDGLQVPARITEGGAPTANEIASRLNETAP